MLLFWTATDQLYFEHSLHDICHNEMKMYAVKAENFSCTLLKVFITLANGKQLKYLI